MKYGVMVFYTLKKCHIRILGFDISIKMSIIMLEIYST